ncbi:CAIB/BAIF family protein [uncultured delta proteobacterium]|uniref:CAIB/BAIF family protein n=1 Tax=uncultured delta proteobacterium TaxID=34034 RepID=A0A212K6T3_9DELT|nr:CAIB/BAIF family protein [uncultured delta proteobacterium]
MQKRENALPLSGLTVIDAATMLAAPWAAAFLGDYGARVIKIEHPEKGDTVRAYGRQKNGVSLFWKTLARNKEAITLNLGKPEGQAIFKKLAAKADVVIENYRPGTMERWGIGWDALSEINPSLIMLRVSAFGQTGPYSSRPGFGTVAEAMSGFASVNGAKDQPTLPGIALADGVCGVFSALSVMIAVHERSQNPGNRGQYIDMALYEPLMRLLDAELMAYDQLGVVAKPSGNSSESFAPRNAYQCKDGTWMALSGSAQPIAARVFQAIGRPELINDERFCDNAARLRNVKELDSLIGSWIKERDMDEVQHVFGEVGAVIGPMYTTKQVYEDPHYIYRESFAAVEDHELGATLRMPNVMGKFSRTPGRISHAGQPMGKSNTAIFRNMLGLSEEECAALRAKGII